MAGIMKVMIRIIPLVGYLFVQRMGREEQNATWMTPNKSEARQVQALVKVVRAN